MSGYRGRFAPSPTGLLHAGSLVAALASWLDARAHSGAWLVRIEDVDLPRCLPAAADQILRQLATCGLVSDEPVLRQSDRGAAYQAALDRLIAKGWAYPCGCTRKDIAQALLQSGAQRERHGELVYPGRCRPANGGLQGRLARAWRLDIAALSADLGSARHAAPERPAARRAGAGCRRAGRRLRAQARRWTLAYQLAVVVDDAEQGITDIVRAARTWPTTARARSCCSRHWATRGRYLHTPLVCGANGEKLSKQNGAAA